MKGNPGPALVLGIGAAIMILGSCKPGGPTEPIEEPGPGSETSTFPVTLEWNAPTVDAQGEPLEDLQGYRIHFRASPPANGPGAGSVNVGVTTRATVDDVPEGVWHFGVTALDQAGNQSALSNEVRVEVGP